VLALFTLAVSRTLVVFPSADSNAQENGLFQPARDSQGMVWVFTVYLLQRLFLNELLVCLNRFTNM
jgi:hypothetical protein